MNSFSLVNLLSGLMLACFCCNVFAEWQQGQATVMLNGAEVADVRVMAIKNAIADAAFQNGSFVAAEDVVLDGLLVSSKSVLTTQGRIQRVEILSETANEDSFSVVVRVDISPLMDCQTDPYARSVLITQFQILKPQQASYGGIFDLGKQISKRVERQLAAEHSSPQVQLINKAFTDFRAHDEINGKELTEKSIYMAKEYNRQFILFGFIRDISLFEQVKKNLLKDDVSLRRNFTLQVYVLDAYRHTIIFQDSYHSEADWVFSNDYSVDTNNSLFWRSDYGRVVLNTVNSAVSDVANILQCEKSYAQVINNEDHQLTINMGADSGVKLGDKFILNKKRLVIGSSGNNNPILQPYPEHHLKVIQVDNRTAVLESAEPPMPVFADLSDLLSPTL